MLDRIDPGRLRTLVEALPGPRNRFDAAEAMRATDAMLIDAWRAAGWRTGRQPVAPEGWNLVAIAEGTTREAIVVVAHHDTVAGSPGADDNGAGVAAFVELASLLGGGRRRRTVILAAPDHEEIGLLGSRPLVAWLRRHYQVRGAIVFDPIGFMDPRPGTQSVPSRHRSPLSGPGRSARRAWPRGRHGRLDLPSSFARSRPERGPPAWPPASTPIGSCSCAIRRTCR